MSGKQSLLRWSAALCFAALLFCCARVSLAQTGRWVAAGGTMEPVVESAELISSAGIDGESTVTVAGKDAVQVNLGTMTVPGAYAQIRVTVKNSGNLSAYLKKVTKTDCELERIHIYFPDITVEEEPALGEGDRCTFSMVVQWDPEDTEDTDGLETGTFAMTLSYENDELVFVADEPEGAGDSSTNTASGADSTSASGSSSSASDCAAVTAAATGDSAAIWFWYLLAVVAGAGFLLCLRSVRKTDRKA